MGKQQLIPQYILQAIDHETPKLVAEFGGSLEKMRARLIRAALFPPTWRDRIFGNHWVRVYPA